MVEAVIPIAADRLLLGQFHIDRVILFAGWQINEKGGLKNEHDGKFGKNLPAIPQEPENQGNVQGRLRHHV